jgi:DNA polymerase-1
LKHAEDIENTRARNNILANPDMAKLSKKLATIKCDCKLDIKPEACTLGDMWNEEAHAQIEKLEFKSILARFEQGVGASEMKLENLVISDDVNDLKGFLDTFSKGEVLAVKPVLREKNNI